MVHLNMDEIQQRVKNRRSMKDEAVSKINPRVDEILGEIQKKVNEEVNKFSRFPDGCLATCSA